MERQRSIGEYRIIDIVIMGIMLAIFESLIVTASRSWFANQLYTASLAAALTSICYMRWGPWGAIYAVESAVVFCVFSSATQEQFVIYIIGNLFSLPIPFIMKKIGKEKVRTSELGLIFPMLVQLLMHVGRATVGLVLGHSLSEVLAFFTRDSLSYIFTFVIIWIARKLDGVYEDQIHYLLRLKEQEKEEQEGGIL